MTLAPTPEQLRALAADPGGGPVVMLNLLRFKDHADGVDAADGISGAAAYERYAAAAIPHLERVGGRLVYALRTESSVIGPGEPEWDLVLAVEYPSRAAFMSMIADPDYLAAHAHREAALADSRLIACAAAAA